MKAQTDVFTDREKELGKLRSVASCLERKLSHLGVERGYIGTQQKGCKVNGGRLDSLTASLYGAKRNMEQQCRCSISSE